MEGGGGERKCLRFPRSLPVLYLAKTVCYWNTVALQIGLDSFVPLQNAEREQKPSEVVFPFDSSTSLLMHVLIKLCNFCRPSSNVCLSQCTAEL